MKNKDQVKGSIKEAAGKVQEKTGELDGSTTQQVKGLTKEAEGRAQKAVGDVKDAVKNRRSNTQGALIALCEHRVRRRSGWP